MASRKNELLNILSEVKSRVQDKLGIVDFPMPQFVIIGSQSVGKSRLIEAMVGEQFNFISGTLGSRRPTVLEFRNLETAKDSRWYVQDKESMQWKFYTTAEVMKVVGDAHNSLGQSVSADPIYVRVESANCVDMQIVDLPGYRSYAANDKAKALAEDIERLNGSFINDSRNVILCVEEAGDAANLSSLRRVVALDPKYDRSILIRNKLDKYYGDLDTSNVNKWLEGMGDLPKNLKKFALTLPHWNETQPPPKKLSEMRHDMDKQDLNKFSSLGASKASMSMVGFGNFTKFMEQKTERMFVEAIGPVLSKLRDLEQSMTTRDEDLVEELETSNPESMMRTVRECGMSFANCLTHIMEGYIRSDINRYSLEDELREFYKYHQQLGVHTDEQFFVPSVDFGSLDDYIDYLKNYIRVPGKDLAINGGAQFTRLMFEVETFLRFSEIGVDTKKRDVMQAFGVTMGSVTWSDVVVKLLNHDAHLPLQKHLKYVGERVKWFFIQQKDPIVHFMKSLKGQPDEKLYSVLYTKHANLIESNPTMRKLVYEAYDAVVDRQLVQFNELFKSTLQATFSNPFVFLKKASASLEDQSGEEVLLPSLDDTKMRIPDELARRGKMEAQVRKWLGDIPMKPDEIDDAVDQIQLLVLKIYSHIRSQVCDQVELFCESFFKLPLLRRLEEDMNKIELSDVDKEGYRVRRSTLERDTVANKRGLKEVQECYKALSDFQLRGMAGPGLL